MERKDFYIPSRDGVHKLHVVLWEPDMAPRAVVQISHGMTEMIDRYEDFAMFLTRNGYAVIGNDHLGHGLTAGNDSDLGYFCPKNMSATVVADLHRVTKYAKKSLRGFPIFCWAQHGVFYGQKIYYDVRNGFRWGSPLWNRKQKPPGFDGWRTGIECAARTVWRSFSLQIIKEKCI